MSHHIVVERTGRTQWPWAVRADTVDVAAFVEEVPAREYAAWLNGQATPPAKPDSLSGPTGACSICGAPIYSKRVGGTGDPVAVWSCDWPHADLVGSPYYQAP